MLSSLILAEAKFWGDTQGSDLRSCHNVTRIFSEIIIKLWLYIDEHIFFPLQGFANSGKGVGGWVGGEGVNPPPTVVESEILLGGGVTGWLEPEQGWFWRFEQFSMLETIFCECWTSI